jgi:hypothetical protein
MCAQMCAHGPDLRWFSPSPGDRRRGADLHGGVCDGTIRHPPSSIPRRLVIRQVVGSSATRLTIDQAPPLSACGDQPLEVSMLTASPDEPLGASSEEIVVPRYLLYFAIPPAITTLVLSILDPMLGMTLLACSFVMWVVLRIVLRQAPIQCQSGTVEESVLKARGLPGLGQSRWAQPPPGHEPVRNSSPKTSLGHGLTDRHREERPIKRNSGDIGTLQHMIRSISDDSERR